MIIKNLTKKTTLSKDAKFATSLKDKSLGLLLPTNPKTLIFKTRFGIHTFGLKKPIDVLVLNQKFKVIKIKKSLKPNRFFFWNPKYNLIIELPASILLKTNTQLGDLISLT